MTSALELIGQAKQGDLSGLKTNPWLRYLALAEEIRVNLERIDSLEELQNNYILNYVERSLKALEELHLPDERQMLLEEVLVWSEVAKGGMKHQRKRWEKQGVNLMVKGCHGDDPKLISRRQSLDDLQTSFGTRIRINHYFTFGHLDTPFYFRQLP